MEMGMSQCLRVLNLSVAWKVSVAQPAGCGRTGFSGSRLTFDRKDELEEIPNLWNVENLKEG
jgi:hypothetical protein